MQIAVDKDREEGDDEQCHGLTNTSAMDKYISYRCIYFLITKGRLITLTINWVIGKWAMCKLVAK
jgi:hypothetical protein